MKDSSKLNVSIAVAQLTSAATVHKNISAIEAVFNDVDTKNVNVVCLPECSNLIQRDPVQAIFEITTEDQDPFIEYCRKRAAHGGYWVHIGSVAVRDRGETLFSNRSLVIDNLGHVVCKYDKIHLFDVNLGDGSVHNESSRYRPGDQAILCDSGWGKWGMSVCYDLRFPHLYRSYAKAGANILFIPAAFTVPTGKMHWEVLLRSRAIENGCYVIAAAQCGRHEDGRETYGHSMVINPMGEVIADAGLEQGIMYLNLDLSLVEKSRRSIPSLKNERAFNPPSNH